MPNVGPPRILNDPSRIFDRQQSLDVVRASRNNGRSPMPGGIVLSPSAENPNEFRSRTLAENGVGGLIDHVS